LSVAIASVKGVGKIWVHTHKGAASKCLDFSFFRAKTWRRGALSDLVQPIGPVS
jgi:hypothetical protein